MNETFGLIADVHFSKLRPPEHTKSSEEHRDHGHDSSTKMVSLSIFALAGSLKLMISTREVGTLNDFREFFGMKRHETFESISKNSEIQDALRDLYEHPDKVELYPGVFCESDEA